MSFEIYLVEDEKNLNDVLSSYLEKEGWKVTTFFNGEDAEKKIKDEPHLWILDIMLTGMDGYQLIRKIREFSLDIPIIFISARDADLDRILGLEMGSDDYLAKPFLPRELVIRAKKLLDRVYGKIPGYNNSCIIKYPPYLIDVNKRNVKIDDIEIRLTFKEYELLCLFIKNIGQTFSRDQILTEVWGEDYYGSDRTVDDLVRRLRKKLPALKVETIYGYGYRVV
ncbi:response regulator transcription factor [Brassicibacter mesophilus]|uniref:response regulator transcription factor n=1 Tax=Brassicibacter mesophilus TaxID=745119 RepID=UPI003D248478